MNAVSPPPAGWYPDPSGRAPFRYWDGSRWTEHTDQGTAPSPSPAAPLPPNFGAPTPQQPGYPPAQPAAYAPAQPAGFAPAQPSGYPPAGYPPAAPGVPGAQPGYNPYAAAAPVAAAAPSTGRRWTDAKSFLDDAKKADGFALVVIGALLFFVFSFLPWADVTVSGGGTTKSDGSNAWDGESVWLIRGFEVTDNNVLTIVNGGNVDAGTDMVVLLPIALAAAGVAGAIRLGKRVNKGNEIVLGASGLLAVVMIAEAVHVNSALSEAASITGRITIPTANGDVLLSGAGSLGFGIYLAILATVVMVGGAAKVFLANRNNPAA